MSSAALKLSGLMGDTSVVSGSVPRASLSPSRESLSPNPSTSTPMRSDAQRLSEMQMHDPDGWLVDALVKLPPGAQLHEAWSNGPDALFSFLNALWVAELSLREIPESNQIRLDTNPDRLRILADMRNDDELEHSTYEIAL